MPSLTNAQALDLAMQNHREGRLGEAEGIYRQILAVNPFQADALRLLGLIAHQRGDHPNAVELIGRAIAQNPGAAGFYNDLGNALQCLRRFDEAVAAYRQALALQPDFAPAYNNLGTTLKHQGRNEEAVTAYQRALEFQPDLAEVHHNLANALMDLGCVEEAIAAFERALHFQPDLVMASNNLGNALLSTRQVEAAIAAYRRAIDADPRFALAYNNLGNALKDHGDFDGAVAAYREAIRCQPELADAHSNLGTMLNILRETEEALASLRRAVELQPDSHIKRSNLLTVLHYSPHSTPAHILEAHCEFDRRHAAPLRADWQPHGNVRQPDRPLRLGFISPHFASHPAGRFLIRTLENFDSSQFHVTCYSDTPDGDEMTGRLMKAANRWHETARQTDGELTQRIRQDGIDILFDLAGHTSGNRLLVFARKPAPIQITWIDYVGTTGLAAMDYILADAREIPPAAEVYYREKVLRMPDDYICYDPPAGAPPVSVLPASHRGQITFGSFNLAAKITDQMVGVWSRILQRVPQARLILKNRGLELYSTGVRLRSLFAGHGIAAERVELLGHSTPMEVLEHYHQIDIALDTFPYNGGLTTCEALWMGVPVITCPGETFASRHGLTHLSAVGLTETIAADLDDYVERAVALAQDLPRLAALRASLRERVANSPLCDGSRFAANLAVLLREAWREWCAHLSA